MRGVFSMRGRRGSTSFRFTIIRHDSTIPDAVGSCRQIRSATTMIWAVTGGAVGNCGFGLLVHVNVCPEWLADGANMMSEFAGGARACRRRLDC